MTEHPEAQAIFAEYGIEVVPANVMPANGQTRAIATLDRIRNRHGEAHARFVVMTLSETANNKAFIDETSLWVISDMVRAAAKNYPELVENNVSAWFAFFDGLPLGWLQYWALDLDGVISKRHALGGMIYERMRRRFGALAVQPDLLDDRRTA
ncbi:hypothetical protein [Rhizobium sp. P32RR-XVIII]|uniref:hypothetical protein n=1 Tax=Rhizobium sp. P32RR-XVIII TaxID=2726738 RepID=UPI001FF0086F|nr:hypothetical protein [Rhizobium sp. P32RR-XVIII]